MGQKVNPIGFRLAVSKDWRSKWFATGKEFSDSLHSDIAIRNYLREKLNAEPLFPRSSSSAHGTRCVSLSTPPAQASSSVAKARKSKS
jgi:hypothetical protein